jgi:hypothetical protein
MMNRKTHPHVKRQKQSYQTGGRRKVKPCDTSRKTAQRPDMRCKSMFFFTIQLAQNLSAAS